MRPLDEQNSPTQGEPEGEDGWSVVDAGWDRTHLIQRACANEAQVSNAWGAEHAGSSSGMIEGQERNGWMRRGVDTGACGAINLSGPVYLGLESGKELPM